MLGPTDKLLQTLFPGLGRGGLRPPRTPPAARGLRPRTPALKPPGPRPRGLESRGPGAQPPGGRGGAGGAQPPPPKPGGYTYTSILDCSIMAIAL